VVTALAHLRQAALLFVVAIKERRSQPNVSVIRESHRSASLWLNKCQPKPHRVRATRRKPCLRVCQKYARARSFPRWTRHQLDDGRGIWGKCDPSIGRSQFATHRVM